MTTVVIIALTRSMIISQLVKVERETESHMVHGSNPGVNRSRAHKGRHVRMPSVDSTEVLKEYLCFGIPQTVCTDVLTVGDYSSYNGRFRNDRFHILVER